jgi:alpha-L-fucosidase
MKKLLAIILFALQVCSLPAVAQQSADRLQWFRDAKLGIFIHWGIYAVNGVSESWSFHNKDVSYPDYMAQMKGFTASKFDASAWADLIAQSGARYTVLTTKHHDGVALYDTKLSSLDVVNSTPAKRDLLQPFYDAIRKKGLKAGAYYSLIDWSYPDYPGFLKDSSRYKASADAARWNRFLSFCHGQIAEVMDRYKPDLVWFDGDWEHSADEWKAPAIRQLILDRNPNTIINSRLQGYGDYATPEQHIPVSRPSGDVWEMCMTSNNNWGYRPVDKDYKTPYELITIFADVVSNGGNLLFDIGPREDGTIPEEQANLLRELGKWNERNGKGIFATVPGLPYGHFYGPSTLSKDSTKLYLFLPSGAGGKAMVKGLYNKVKKVTVLGSAQNIPSKVVGKISWSSVPGILYIDEVPAAMRDPYMTVLELELDGAMKLYRGKGGFN